MKRASKKTTCTCESCGKPVNDNLAPGHDEGLIFCNDCAAIMTATCCICGASDHMWNMTSTSQGEIYCENCATALT